MLIFNPCWKDLLKNEAGTLYNLHQALPLGSCYGRGTQYPGYGLVPSVRWWQHWFRNKVNNKCNALDLSGNYPSPPVCGKIHSHETSPGAKKVEDCCSMELLHLRYHDTEMMTDINHSLDQLIKYLYPCGGLYRSIKDT